MYRFDLNAHEICYLDADSIEYDIQMSPTSSVRTSHCNLERPKLTYQEELLAPSCGQRGKTSLGCRYDHV